MIESGIHGYSQGINSPMNENIDMQSVSNKLILPYMFNY